MDPHRPTTKNTALLVIDVQEKLVPHVENSQEILCSIQKAIQSFQILGCPIFVTEQSPDKLGRTVSGIQSYFSNTACFFSKTSFSALQNPLIKTAVLDSGIDNWVLIGLEAHICILQTAKDLIAMKKRAIVPNDAISSRSIYDFSTAIAEMRDFGVRITSIETLLFEMVGDAASPFFKGISQLVK